MLDICDMTPCNLVKKILSFGLKYWLHSQQSDYKLLYALHR